MPHKTQTTKINIFLYLIIPAIILVIFIMIMFGADARLNNSNIEYITSLGWEVDEKCADISYFSIPEEFDSVYCAYNNIVKDANFDLSLHRGRRAVRYSYNVLNYPSPHTTARINIILADGEIISADISSYGADGFIKPLTPRTE